MDTIKEVKVKGVELDAEDGAAFVQYVVQVKLIGDEDFTYAIRRRYKQVLSFHGDVIKILDETGHSDIAANVPKLPGRSMYGNLTNTVIAPRLAALPVFLNFCLKLSDHNSAVAIILGRFLRRPNNSGSLSARDVSKISNMLEHRLSVRKADGTISPIASPATSPIKRPPSPVSNVWGAPGAAPPPPPPPEVKVSKVPPPDNIQHPIPIVNRKEPATSVPSTPIVSNRKDPAQSVPSPPSPNRSLFSKIFGGSGDKSYSNPPSTNTTPGTSPIFSAENSDAESDGPNFRKWKRDLDRKHAQISNASVSKDSGPGVVPTVTVPGRKKSVEPTSPVAEETEESGGTWGFLDSPTKKKWMEKEASKKSKEEEERDMEIERQLQSADAPSAEDLHLKHMVLLQLLYAPQISASGKINQDALKKKFAQKGVAQVKPKMEVTTDLPKWLVVVLDHLTVHGKDAEEIFRTSHSPQIVSSITNVVAAKECTNETLMTLDVTVLAAVVLNYFRTSESSLIPVEQYYDLITLTLPSEVVIDELTRCNKIKEIFKFLHADRLAIVRSISYCLAAVTTVKLTLLCYTFGPHIMHQPPDTDPSLVEVNAVNQLVEIMVLYKDIIFQDVTPAMAAAIIQSKRGKQAQIMRRGSAPNVAMIKSSSNTSMAALSPPPPSSIPVEKLTIPTSPPHSASSSSSNLERFINPDKFESSGGGIDDTAHHRKNSNIGAAVLTKSKDRLSPVISPHSGPSNVGPAKRKHSNPEVSSSGVSAFASAATGSGIGEVPNVNLENKEEIKAILAEVAELRFNLKQQQQAQEQWGKSIQTILMATAFNASSSTKYRSSIQKYLDTKVGDLASYGIDDPKLQVTDLVMPSKSEELPFLQLINYSPDNGVQWMLDWKAKSFKLDLHLEGRKLVKFKSEIQVQNIFLAGVIWLKILGDGSFTVCFSKLPAIAFDLKIESKVGKIPINIEKQMKKWLDDKMKGYFTKNLVFPNWRVLKR